MALSKKREPRKLLGQQAWITLDGGFAARQCVVADISSAGARIILEEAIAMPAPGASARWSGAGENPPA